MESLALFLLVALGAGLGALYLWMLHLTVASLISTQRPFVLLALSAVFRVGLLLGAFVLLSGMEPARLGALLIGFMVARIAATALAAEWPRARAAGCSIEGGS
jgi:F1F0 ATPase subunit 2